jgi:hypothetical protein
LREAATALVAVEARLVDYAPALANLTRAKHFVRSGRRRKSAVARVAGGLPSDPFELSLKYLE